MKTINVTCTQCGLIFDKLLKEYNRCIKNDMKHFCSRSCTRTFTNHNMPSGYWNTCPTSKNVEGYTREDELSPFRQFLRSNKYKIKKKEVSIDEKYLKELWNSQDGICPYTKLKMVLPKNTNRIHNSRTLIRASLDRIDSSKGYIDGNVEFVCYGINLAKNNFSKSEMLNFINSIRYDGNTLGITQPQPT